ncbi:hypothetical protein GI374_07470 [Paracoccus sp. S-4012]|uniref:hypothetical protein n=1 Tax=Paracoccus sp. S-4012 TaxID=2665648 RepID=UPI0012AF5CBD|nr:hypothetical protein [Paracoccus sp. S-4012]MRX50288.1 hypothetical protein [Paracoccus sp. S-4012]
MFDSLTTEDTRDVLGRVRSFFLDHGHQVAMAASMIGGAAAEARVVSCALHLEGATRIDHRIKRDLAGFHRLLSLHDVQDLDDFGIGLFSELHPASAEVETICVLTDLLEDLLREIDTAADRPGRNDTTGASIAA